MSSHVVIEAAATPSHIDFAFDIVEVRYALLPLRQQLPIASSWRLPLVACIAGRRKHTAYRRRHGAAPTAAGVACRSSPNACISGLLRVMAFAVSSSPPGAGIEGLLCRQLQLPH